MKLRYHSNKLSEKWLVMSVSEQLGNLGSEVRRAAKWLKRGNINLMKKYIERAVELLNLTIIDSRWQNHRQKELKMAREILADTFYGNREYGYAPEDLERYFFQYAVAARRRI